MSKNKDYNRLPIWLTCSVLASFLLAIGLLVFYFWFFHGEIPSKQEVWGQFGDYVGGILNPLFSIVGLLALLYTIRLQSREMANSTQELARSAEALNIQTYYNEQQTFDSRIFHLMGLHAQTLSSLHFFEPNPNYSLGHDEPLHYEMTGVSAVRYAFKELVGMQDFYDRDDFLLSLDHASGRYADWKVRYGQEMSLYLACVKNIMSFVQSSSKHRPNKFAIELIRSQFSAVEQSLLFYVSLFDEEMRVVFPFMVKNKFCTSTKEGRYIDYDLMDMFS